MGYLPRFTHRLLSYARDPPDDYFGSTHLLDWKSELLIWGGGEWGGKHFGALETGSECVPRGRGRRNPEEGTSVMGRPSKVRTGDAGGEFLKRLWEMLDWGAQPRFGDEGGENGE